MRPRRPLKVVFMGASGVGKTSLVRAYMHGSFSDMQESTIGGAYSSLTMRFDARRARLVPQSGPFAGRSEPPVEDDGPASAALSSLVAAPGELWTVEVWDTAGQERYATLLPMYYRTADVVVVVHDATSSALDRAQQCLAAVETECVGNPVVLVVQNKADVLLQPAVACEWQQGLQANHLRTALASAKHDRGFRAPLESAMAEAVERRLARCQAEGDSDLANDLEITRSLGPSRALEAAWSAATQATCC